MQKVTWFGVGNGSLDDPILLINSASFSERESFNIEILSGDYLPQLDTMYIKFSTFQPEQIFKLGVMFTNLSPLMPITSVKASTRTAFNGNNNYGIVDGPYTITVRDDNKYVLRQHLFTRDENLTRNEIMEAVKDEIQDYITNSGIMNHTHGIDDIFGLRELYEIVSQKSDMNHSHTIDHIHGLLDALASMNEKLISGENIVTINGESILQGKDLQFAKTWDEVSDKPTEFKPEDHTHEISEINGLEPRLSSIETVVPNLADKNHTHDMDEVTGLVDSVTTINRKITDIENVIPDFAPKSHGHSIQEVSGLQDELDSKRNKSDELVIRDIVSLESTLKSKSNVGHSHTVSDVTGLTDILLTKLTQSDINDLIKTGRWNNTTQSLILTREDNSEISINIPIDQLFNDVEVTHNKIIFSKPDGTSVEIEINSLLSGVVRRVNGMVPSSGDIYIAVNDIPGLAERLDVIESTLNDEGDSLVTTTKLNTILQGYSVVGHSHTSASITDFNTAVSQIAATVNPKAHTHRITDVSDINLGSLTSGQVLMYNSVTGKWENKAITWEDPVMSASDITNKTTAGKNVTGKLLADTFDTKAQVNDKIKDFVKQSDIDTAIANIDFPETDISHLATKTEVSLKANTSEVNTALSGKADKSTTYTKTEVDTKITDAVTDAAVDLDGYVKDIGNNVFTGRNEFTQGIKAGAVEIRTDGAKVQLETTMQEYNFDKPIVTEGKTVSTVGHAHSISDIDNLTTELAGKASTTHTHSISQITGLADALSSKLEQENLDNFFNGATFDPASHRIVLTNQRGEEFVVDLDIEGLIKNIELDSSNNLVLSFDGTDDKVIPLNVLLTGVVKKINGKTPDALGSITITMSDIEGLNEAINAKANATHGHTISDITGLSTELSGKALVSHSHIISDITGLQSTLDAKQALLRAGINIKTVNGQSILGEGNINTSTSDSVTVNLSLEGTWKLINNHTSTSLVPATEITLDEEILSNDILLVEFGLDSYAAGNSRLYPIFTPSLNTPQNRVIITADDTAICVVEPYVVGNILNLDTAYKVDLSTGTIDKINLFSGRVMKLNNDSTSVVRQMTEAELHSSNEGGRFVSGKLLMDNFHTKKEVLNLIADFITLSTFNSRMALKSDVGHKHEISDVNGLETRLETIESTASNHTHTTVQITGLDSTLTQLRTDVNAKANASHTHAYSEITGRPSDMTAADISTPNATTRTVSSKTLTDVFYTKDQVDADKATKEELNLKQNKLVAGANIKIQGDTISVEGITGNVESVNGEIGHVVIDKSSVGLSNVDNTSDTSKPVSTAQQAALDLKVNISGDVTISGRKNFTGTLLSKGIEVATIQDLSTVFRYKGNVTSYASLPTTNRNVGDTYNVTDTGKNYAWSGTAWDDLAGIVDLSNYFTKDEINTLLAGKLSIASDVTTYEQVYAKSASGEQKMMDATPNAIANAAVVRDSGGRASVSDPTSDTHATNKIYVDGLVNAKQDKLVAGDNITIDENNVISASRGGDVSIWRYE